MSGRIKLSCLICFILMCLTSVSEIFGQGRSIFETASVEHSLKNKFHLTSKELRILQPMLRQQNAQLMISLDRCMDADQIDYLSFWNRLRTLREEFESVSIKGLTQRQKQAIRAARFDFELRILDIWHEVYLNNLSRALELSWIQSTFIDDILQRDKERRSALLTAASTTGKKMLQSWDKLSIELEMQIEDSLTPDQKADYREMKIKSEKFVG